jgi:hypothetical protein
MIKKNLLSILVLFIFSLTIAACQDCLECVGNDDIRIDSIRQNIDTLVSGNDTTFNTTYPSFFDSTLTGNRIGDFCDDTWKDYDGKQMIEITTLGDSVTGAQVWTITTDWTCN